MKQRALYSTLAFAGLLPFLAAAIASLVGAWPLVAFATPDDLANGYGLVIVCFLAGIHWATAIYHESAARNWLLLVSNVILLAVWIAYVFSPMSVSLLVQITALNVMLGIDFGLKEDGLISAQYWRVRLIATALASISLLVVMLT